MKFVNLGDTGMGMLVEANNGPWYPTIYLDASETDELGLADKKSGYECEGIVKLHVKETVERDGKKTVSIEVREIAKKGHSEESTGTDMLKGSAFQERPKRTPENY